MRKVKLIVHETYQDKRKIEDVFAALNITTKTTSSKRTYRAILLPLPIPPAPLLLVTLMTLGVFPPSRKI